MRKTVLVSVPMLAVLTALAACEPTSPPALEDLRLDPGPADVPQDPAPEVPPADARPDGVPVDVPADGPAEVPADAVAELPGDLPPVDTPPVDVPVDVPLDARPDACEPVACTLWCEFGFADGPDGCPVCACRDCAEGTRVAYDCPGGAKVPWGECGADGWDWLAHPEHACPTLCVPGRVDRLPCGDGTSVEWCTCAQDDACRPECRAQAGGTATWVDPCTDKAILERECVVGRPPACAFIGSRSEGWYDAQGLVAWASCGPVRTCAPDAADACPSARCTTADAPATWECPGGAAVPFCACDVPAAKCPPECRFVGSKSEGWYDGCTGGLLKYDTCDGCTVACDAVGSKSEGWYSSCTGLVAWAMCATGTWACATEPWDACPAPAPPMGGLCGDAEDCAKELLCLTASPDARPGVCTKVCNPMAMGPARPCPPAFECVPVPDHEAPGFCLPACADDLACVAPLACGRLAGADAFPATCFDW